MLRISQRTVQVMEDFTRPLVGMGTLHKSEQKAVLQILKEHVSGAQPSAAAKVWFTLDEVSGITKLSKKTLSRMIQSNELEGKYLRKGSPKTLRIKASSLETLMAQKREASQ